MTRAGDARQVMDRHRLASRLIPLVLAVATAVDVALPARADDPPKKRDEFALNDHVDTKLIKKRVDAWQRQDMITSQSCKQRRTNPNTLECGPCSVSQHTCHCQMQYNEREKQHAHGAILMGSKSARMK